ncbi:unnamed protein product [Bursaphelenchus okinawaensis]|uniref:Uncharacterized protein n=1 Tax=Bursaphelenchus okinawaensis TaxID=465554 RepID=A0A811K3X2_9BILA|nr:unnamed protein product [Bursaphelenchus okinawaensis]CAG9091249.1 unnamed protein product [Bursaphelenchus okinawaensis]
MRIRHRAAEAAAQCRLLSDSAEAETYTQKCTLLCPLQLRTSRRRNAEAAQNPGRHSERLAPLPLDYGDTLLSGL